jgi:hypothetical protein
MEIWIVYRASLINRNSAKNTGIWIVLGYSSIWLKRMEHRNKEKITWHSSLFFFDKGAKIPSLCINWCTRPFYCKYQKYSRFKCGNKTKYNHGSDIVATWINQRKRRHKARLAILYPITVLPSSSPEKEVLSNHKEPGASGIHILALVLR